MKTKKVQDERVVAETNRIYKVGYYVFTVGIALDMLWRVASTPDGVASSTFEWFVFMAAQLVCIILSSRRGIYTEDAGAEKFNWKKHIVMFTGVGVLAGVVLTMVNRIQYSGSIQDTLLIGAITTCSTIISTLVIGLVGTRIIFAWAKARREKQERDFSGEDE